MEKEAIDGDGLPFIDDATLANWRAEALQNIPAPNDWADLIVNLRWAAELDRRGIEIPELPKGLTASEHALRAILAFMHRQPLLMKDGGYIAPIMRLSHAICDTANGRPSPLFKPVKQSKGTPGKGVVNVVIQAFAAKTMTECMLAGDKKDVAAKSVVKALHKGRKDMRDLTPSKVKNWRDRILAGPGDGAPNEAIKHYNEPLPPGLGATSRQRADNLLKILAERSDQLG